MANPEGLVEETRIGRVCLRVNDLDRMINFYQTVVGLDVRQEGDGRAVLGAGGEPLLVLVADPGAPERTPDEAGLFHTAFLVPSRVALADALGRIEEHWRLDGASDHRVSEALYLSDPEDNGIEVYCDRPTDEWPTADDGTVGMETLPLDLDEIRKCSRNDATAPPETTVGHVHLEVSSLSASREFYVETLGMRVRQTYGASALFVAAGDYHHYVGLNVWNRRRSPAEGRGLEWFELVLPDREALGAVRRRFDDRDVGTTATEEGIDVTDPDGITLELHVAG